jgi:hypothetical protein
VRALLTPVPITAFVLGDRLDRAMVAYEHAHAWRQLFALAISEKLAVEELSDMCERVSGEPNAHALRRVV